MSPSVRVASRFLEALADDPTMIFDTLPKKKLRVSPKEMSRLASSGGDCYKANGQYFMDNAHRQPNLRLVHGEVMGQGELQGISYGHCWCEIDGDVLDFSNGREIRIDKRIYYAIGSIDRINNFHTYDLMEFNERLSEFAHWGPWDLKTKTGL